MICTYTCHSLFYIHGHFYIYTAPPQIYTHPMDISVEVNNDSTSVTFTCMAHEALSYFWEKEGGDIPSSAEGVNSSSLLLHGILPPDSGRYQCAAGNKYSRTYSRYAMLIVTGTYVCIAIDVLYMHTHIHNY